ncbi:sugar phosphate isomerase/epimerase family protein [Hamadaea sp. NPDC051192]|uniref:sugar phosphate isomerase/epimerase family protein n=1 Tax=Hamadaea sp. NPDC051192 TaxID=3154940 RepID=UPI003412601D
MAELTSVRLEPDISLAPVSFGDQLKTGEMTTAQFLATAVELGFTAVELCDRTVREPSTVAAQLANLGLRMPSIALRNDFTGDPESSRASVSHLRHWLEVAAEFGCRTARIWTGWQRSDAVARGQVTEALDELVDSARMSGVALAVETHGGLSNEPAFLAELCDRYPREHFGVCIDFGNLPAATRREAIAAIAPLTTHVHVKSHEFTDDGVEAGIPLAWAIETVSKHGFDAQWVIEYEGAPPYKRGIDLTVATLRGVLGRSERHADGERLR